MARLAPLDIAFFALESQARPMHAGALMLFEPPAKAESAEFVDRVIDDFEATAPVAPFERRPRLGLGGPPSWEVCEHVDIGYHVRRLALPAPGSSAQLMDLVGHLYPALLDRSRPLWECYVIEGLENGGFALFYKLHHSLADGITGAKMLFGSLSESAGEERISPLWAGVRSRSKRKRKTEKSSRSLPNPIGLAKSGAGTVAGAGRLVAETVPQALGLREGATALPFSAPRLSTARGRQSAARSFAIFDVSKAEARRVADRAGGSVNDVVLSVCDDAMQRYLAEKGERTRSALVASMAVSTREEGDDTPSNAVAMMQIRLGSPDASPFERLEQVVSSTRSAKAKLGRSSAGLLQAQSLAFLGAAQLREELPVGRGTVPEAANLLVSNIPGGPAEQLYMGGALMTSLHATPILPPAHALNFTLASYAGRLCFGVGAARNVIPDTQRIADLAEQSFAELVDSEGV